MLTLDCISNVFCDALLTDRESRLMFMSIWGRDTTLQELLARLTLSEHEQGIRSFVAAGDGVKIPVQVPDVWLIEKQQARLGHHGLFGELVQVFIYVRTLVTPDRVAQKAWSLYRLEDTETEPDLWPLIVDTCHLPLLEHWRPTVIDAFQQNGWISRLSGYRMAALGIDLGSDEVQHCIETLVMDGLLPLAD